MLYSDIESELNRMVSIRIQDELDSMVSLNPSLGGFLGMEDTMRSITQTNDLNAQYYDEWIEDTYDEHTPKSYLEKVVGYRIAFYNKAHEVIVCHSAAGYYVGQYDNGEPYSRLTEYMTESEAEWTCASIVHALDILEKW